jgi:hypothetical protein
MESVRLLGLISNVVLILAVGLGVREPPRVQADAEAFPTMNSALDAIGSKYNIFIGLEYAVGDADRTPVSLDLSTDRPTLALDSLVARKPAYKWKFEEGVYDVYPIADDDSLLDVTIQRFSVQDATPREVSAAIGDLPEVRQWLLRHHVRRNELETGSRWNESDRRASLTLTGTSFRAVLNRIILITGRRNWLVVRYGDNLEFIGIYI